MIYYEVSFSHSDESNAPVNFGFKTLNFGYRKKLAEEVYRILNIMERRKENLNSKEYDLWLNYLKAKYKYDLENYISREHFVVGVSLREEIERV